MKSIWKPIKFYDNVSLYIIVMIATIFIIIIISGNLYTHYR